MDIDFDPIPDGSFLTEGVHYVACTKADYDQGAHGDWGFKLEWTALVGPMAGRTIRDWLYPTWKGDATNKKCARIKIAAGALGLLPAPGQRTNLPPQAWLGKRCWIEVVEGKPFTDRNGHPRKGYQVAFAGYDTQTPAPPDAPAAAPTPAAPPPPAGAPAFRPSAPPASGPATVPTPF